MKDHRTRIKTNDAVIIAGTLLLFFSVAGMALDWVVSLSPDYRFGLPDTGSPQVLVASGGTPAAQIIVQPTRTPFQAQSPTPIPTLPPIGEAAASSNSFLVPVAPVPTATLEATALPPAPLNPDRIVIPAIQLDAPVIPAAFQLVSYNGQVFQQWDAPPQFAAGWQYSSAPLGMPGNTVLNGHHNVYGSVFGHLVNLNEGDTIELFSGGNEILYVVKNKMILPERDQDLSVRLANASWLESSEDERLTLVTCWPQISNTHRLIIVAVPVQKIMIGSSQGP